MWYKTGTVTYKAGSAILTGKDTLWADDKMGITPGDLVLISTTDDNVMMAEVKTVNSNTEIELRTAFNKDSVTDTKYAIINTLNETLADFAKRISAAILYFNQQSEKIEGMEKRVEERVQKQVQDVISRLNNYVPIGTRGPREEIKWEDPTGIYNQQMSGHSQLVWHMKADGSSARAAQFRFNYQNRGLFYRSARDSVGFERDWAKIYTDQDKPTPADLGVYSKAEADGRYYTKQQSDAGYAAKTSVYTKGESDGRYIPKGGALELNGAGKRLVLGTGNTDVYWSNGKSGKTLQLKDDGRLTYQDGDVYHNGRRPTLDELGAASNNIGKWYNISTKDLPATNFYPLVIMTDRSRMPLRFNIKSESRGGADPYTQCQLEGFVSANGWSDAPKWFHGYYHNYANNKRTLGPVVAGNTDFYGICIYVRGGNTYNIESPVAPVLHKAQVKLGGDRGAVLPVGPDPKPTECMTFIDCRHALPGAHFPNDTFHARKVQTPQVNNIPQVCLGDDDSGLGFRADGAVNIWSNSKVMGYWDTTRLVYNQFMATHADGFRILQGNKAFNFRQDGGNMYFLIHHDQNGMGGWTGHRPITINMTTGNTSLGENTYFNKNVWFSGSMYWTKTAGANFEANCRLWGNNSGRASVLEWGWGGLPYAMFIERNTSLANNQSKLSVNGQIVGQVVNGSDTRLKHNINKVENALETIERLNGYTFQYIGSDAPSAGVIAQELIGVYDNALFVGSNPNDQEDEEDYYTVEYNQLHALHIEAIKELSEKNKSLTTSIEYLMCEVEKLQKELYNMKVNGVSTEAPPINNEETP